MQGSNNSHPQQGEELLCELNTYETSENPGRVLLKAFLTVPRAAQPMWLDLSKHQQKFHTS